MLLPDSSLTLEENLSEFDIWITPSLGEITDSPRFHDELALVTRTFEIISNATNHFSPETKCDPEAIAGIIANSVSGKSFEERQTILQSLASTLFLTTGKSDNNFKCQFPIFLRDEAGWSTLPSIRKRNHQSFVSERVIPRTIKSEDYMSIIAAICDESQEERLLKQILAFLLRDEAASSQLWSIGHSFEVLKQFGKEQSLLAPLVIFKVRGSVMASGGHEPENILRTRLIEWGLEPGIDFNTSDVIVLSSEADPDAKTRAYDFVLPYMTPRWAERWSNRLFIQCQFYAGDSGSVSHKNVDQTASSRNSVLSFTPDALFIEYVDGAGYFSSLNGDLKKLLNYSTTRSFFQVRTSCIRLRRELQRIGFLTPLELEHAICQTDGSHEQILQQLTKEGYTVTEIERCLENTKHRGLVIESSIRHYAITSDRRDLIRRYALLDIVANHGQPLRMNGRNGAGKVLIPGYGAFFGMPFDEMAAKAAQAVPQLQHDIAASSFILSDVRWLCEEKLAMAR